MGRTLHLCVALLGTFALCSPVLAAEVAAQSAAAANDTVLRLARSDDGAVVQVRDLDDPANPYAGQYGAYDSWFWDNFEPNVTDDEKKHFGG